MTRVTRSPIRSGSAPVGAPLAAPPSDRRSMHDITSVELYPGVEVLFRRDDPPGMLFVSVQGRVALVA